jgi:hypothetical protein
VKERPANSQNVMLKRQLMNRFRSHFPLNRRGYSSVPQRKSFTMEPELPLSAVEGKARPLYVKKMQKRIPINSNRV